MGLNAYLLGQQFYGMLDYADSMQNAAQFILVVSTSADEALHNLGNFAFVKAHLLSMGGRHTEEFADILSLIERLEEIQTKVQGMISSPHLVTTLLYNMSQRWTQNLNRCVTASDSEVV